MPGWLLLWWWCSSWCCLSVLFFPSTYNYTGWIVGVQIFSATFYYQFSGFGKSKRRGCLKSPLPLCLHQTGVGTKPNTRQAATRHVYLSYRLTEAVATDSRKAYTYRALTSRGYLPCLMFLSLPIKLSLYQLNLEPQ